MLEGCTQPWLVQTPPSLHCLRGGVVEPSNCSSAFGCRLVGGGRWRRRGGGVPEARGTGEWRIAPRPPCWIPIRAIHSIPDRYGVVRGSVGSSASSVRIQVAGI